MSSPAVRAAFEKFVRAEQDLLAMLQARREQDGAMLAAMAGG